MFHSDFDLSYQNQHTESKIVASLERIAQAFRVLLWQQSKEFSLSPIQVQVLIFLLHHDDQKRKVSYLAGEFNMTKATISDTVKSLEQKSLVTKAQEPNDTRSYTIHLTEQGRVVAEKTSLFSQELRKPIDQLSRDNQEILLGSLLEVIRHLNHSGVITIQRMCASCKYYRRADGVGERLFCTLLNQELKTSDLRIDCPEHELVTE